MERKSKKEKRAETKQEIELVRNYLIDLIGSAVAAGMRDQHPPQKVLDRLAAQEEKILDMIDKDF